MKIRFVNSLRFKFNKNLSDIVKNYEYLTGCDRLKKISQEAYLSVKDPQNGQHYSKLTDLLSFAAVKKIHQKMLTDPIGKKILEEKPRITDQIYNGLKDLNEGTFGKQYFNFMNGLSFKPSERPITKYVPDLQYAYVMQRYKQIHDFLHVLLRKSISVDEQLMIKWFEMRQLNLPSATLASLVSPFLSSQFKLNEISQAIRIADRAQFIMNIDFQKHFPLPINQVRKKFRFE